jgi:hypothetical protein
MASLEIKLFLLSRFLCMQEGSLQKCVSMFQFLLKCLNLLYDKGHCQNTFFYTYHLKNHTNLLNIKTEMVMNKGER